MAKTVFDVLKDKLRKINPQHYSFLEGVELKTSLSIRKLQVWFGVSKPVSIM